MTDVQFENLMQLLVAVGAVVAYGIGYLGGLQQ